MMARSGTTNAIEFIGMIWRFWEDSFGKLLIRALPRNMASFSPERRPGKGRRTLLRNRFAPPLTSGVDSRTLVRRNRERYVLVLYLERPRATVRVRMRFGRALLIQRLEGSRPQGSLCILNGAGCVW